MRDAIQYLLIDCMMRQEKYKQIRLPLQQGRFPGSTLGEQETMGATLK
jgi:hypothetical protein